jgi:hypothetical protein
MVLPKVFRWCCQRYCVYCYCTKRADEAVFAA